MRAHLVFACLVAVGAASACSAITERAGDAGDGGSTNGRDAGDSDAIAPGDSELDGTTPGDGGPSDGITPIDTAECRPGAGCEGLQTCYEGACIPHRGACPCTDDTYCCEACSPMVCLPFGTGPIGATDESCTGPVVIGLFEASTQCEWTGPPEGDPYPNHLNVLGTPLVANLPHETKYGAEIIFVSYNHDDGGGKAGYGSDPAYYGVIRILDGETCEQLETIDDPDNRIIAASPPAIGDLDGDGLPEVVTHRAITGLVAFAWDPEAESFATSWVSTESDISGLGRWDGPSIHDLDDDGFPEVITGGEVYDGRSGARRNPGQVIGGSMVFSVVADVDADGMAELVAGPVHGWDAEANRWEVDHAGGPPGSNYGVGDFGTDLGGPESFDGTTRDGIAELVIVGDGFVAIATLDGDILLRAEGIAGGGPPTVGDFDNDGQAEVASAGGNAYRVFDLECSAGEAPCAAQWVRWLQPSQDLSSRRTGSSIFDFDQDGSAEAVYGDECFTRIYDGRTGAVLYSAFRTSCTWFENPVVADPDRDGNTEILIGTNANCDITCPDIDPIHPGLRCETDLDCPGVGRCVAQLCRCTHDDDCSPDTRCVSPIGEGDESGDVCRAVHPDGVGLQGVRVLRDRLDRWASSRAMWNQHTYSITNVRDDGTVPRTSEWQQTFTLGGPNTFRANAQGDISSTHYTDATARFDEGFCRATETGWSITATVCNRGGRTIGGGMPVTFRHGSPVPVDTLCVVPTPEQIPAGECLAVVCEMTTTPTGSLEVVANDDGAGGRSTLECDDTNNEARNDAATCF